MKKPARHGCRTGHFAPPKRICLLQGLQVHRGIFAATIDFDVVFETVAFVDRRKTRPLDRRNMHERIRLSVIATDEAEALHRVEELDRALRFFAGQLALRPAAESASGASTALTGSCRARADDFHRLAVDLEVGGRNAAAAIDEGEIERLAVGQVGQAGLLDRRYMDEDVLAAIIANDEAESLLRVEEFDDALAFANDLGRHSATAAAAKTAAAATSAAAGEYAVDRSARG